MEGRKGWGGGIGFVLLLLGGRAIASSARPGLVSLGRYSRVQRVYSSICNEILYITPD